METVFFRYLFHLLKIQGIRVYYTLPVKVEYPACECELKESLHHQNRWVLTFSLKLFSDQVTPTLLQGCAEKIKNSLEKQKHEFEKHVCTFHLMEEKILPPHKGTLRQLNQTYQVMIMKEATHDG